MSNKLAIWGRPTKYTKSMPRHVAEYTKKSLEVDKLPTIEGLAVELGIGTRTLYDWETEYSDFSQTMDALRDTQRRLLIENGLNGTYSAQFAMFLLRSIHGMVDRKPDVQATQNNYSNISPEVLADALALMEKNNPR
jgi:hypothetical protein